MHLMNQGVVSVQGFISVCWPAMRWTDAAVAHRSA